ncbi:MAG: hypothetical protein K6U04_10830 [Armatimonadetes bacterium]|nr:hypothetical protein [Armatimonadota bacterium]
MAALVELLGWRYTFAAAGLFSLLVAALSWLIIRDSPRDVFPASRRSSMLSGPVLFPAALPWPLFPYCGKVLKGRSSVFFRWLQGGRIQVTIYFPAGH